MQAAVDFIKEISNEIARQNEFIVRKDRDIQTGPSLLPHAIGRLRSITSQYNDVLRNNRFDVDINETQQSLSVGIASLGATPTTILFALGDAGTFELSVSDPSGFRGPYVDLNDPISVRVSEWKDELFEDELQSVIRELVERRGAGLGVPAA